MPGFEVFGVEERKAVNDLFDANNGILFAHGFVKQRNGIYRVREFEQALAKKVGCAHAQAVSSGTAALVSAIKAMGIGPGDEVITQAFTFVATVEGILAAGATPVIVDVNETLNLDPAELAGKITKRTKLVIPVHMAGVPAQMDEIMRIARSAGLKVLEDGAQAIGSSYRGRALGTIGDAGIFSFDFGKTITCGEGGAVVTNDASLFNEVRCYHDHGHEYNASVPRGLDTRHAPGMNYRLTEIQAAIAIAQLAKLDYIVAAQRANKRKLKDGLKGLPITFRQLPDAEGDSGDTCFIFTENKDVAQKIVRALGAKGLGTKNVPDAMNWHFAGTWDHMIGHFYSQPLPTVFEKTLNLLERTVALPVWVKADEPWIEKYIETVRACF